MLRYANRAACPVSVGQQLALIKHRNAAVLSVSVLSPWGPQSTTFGIFQRHEVSVDVVATSEVSVSLTLDPSRGEGSCFRITLPQTGIMPAPAKLQSVATS